MSLRTTAEAIVREAGQSPKLTWRVKPPLVGRFRSFETRGWPTAYFRDRPAVFLSCPSEYRPGDVRTGVHEPITLTFCHHGHPKAGNSWVRLRMRQTATTLEAAKKLAADWWATHPEYWPQEKP